MSGTQLAGKICLVTGAGSGIGRAAAIDFAEAGARGVVVCDIDIEGGEETVRLIKAAGGEGLFVRADVANGSEVQEVLRMAVDTYGRLDCAFNNAGIDGEMVPTALAAEESWDRVFAVNLKGLWLCMKHELAQMLGQGGGAIVNNASALGLAGFPGMGAYVASKHGVVGLTRAAALEYATEGIRINCVCPGVVRTPTMERVFVEHPEVEQVVIGMEPIGRLADPAEIAHAVTWLCSDAASFVVGHAMAVDGGWLSR